MKEKIRISQNILTVGSNLQNHLVAWARKTAKVLSGMNGEKTRQAKHDVGSSGKALKSRSRFNESESLQAAANLIQSKLAKALEGSRARAKLSIKDFKIRLKIQRRKLPRNSDSHESQVRAKKNASHLSPSLLLALLLGSTKSTIPLTLTTSFA